MTKRKLTFVLALWLLCASFFFTNAQQTVSPIVPPTLVPTPQRAINDFVPTESVVAKIQRDGNVRVGVLYNEPPFGELTVRGEVRGFDADLARKMAEAWGVEVEFIQVTRQNGIEAITNGSIDLLMAALVHQRSLDSVVEFSQTYRISKQAMMVRNDDAAETILNMTNRNIGYVLGTDGERALANWQLEKGITLMSQPYLTLDRAISAMFAGEIDGVVARSEELRRVAADQVFSAKILEDAVTPEPFAIAFQRQDVNLRQLINRTLQHLLYNKTMEALYTTYFDGQAFAEDALPMYGSLGEEAPKPDQFGTDVTFPTQYVLPTMLQNRIVRVAGLFPLAEDASEADRRVHALNTQLVEQMASRWGMSVQLVEGGDVFELLELGLADIAVGVGFDWGVANRVDFTQPYMLHGERLMVEVNSAITSFNELRGKWVGIMGSDSGAQDRAQAWADSINVRVRFYSTFEQDAADAMLQENNADVIYGDSLKLIQHLTANPDTLTLTDRWYSKQYVGFAVPRNDIDVRLLVDYTLQEMVADGTLQVLLTGVLPPNSEQPTFVVLPGSSEYFGLQLRRN